MMPFNHLITMRNPTFFLVGASLCSSLIAHDPPPAFVLLFDGIDDQVMVRNSPLFAITDVLTLEARVKAEPAQSSSDPCIINLCIDGRLAESRPMDNEPFQNLDQSIHIGDRLCDPDASPNFSGANDAIAIWHKPLTLDEVARLPGPKLVEEEKPVEVVSNAPAASMPVGSEHSGFPVDAAKLIATHYGGKPSGSPPVLTWMPQGADAQKFDVLEGGKVITTVDTVLHPSEDVVLVVFRTGQVRDEGIIPGDNCSSCTDWLGLAKYKKGASGEWLLNGFTKWLFQQGVYAQVAKPDLVDLGRTHKVLRIISSTGEPDSYSIDHHFIDLANHNEVLSLLTKMEELDRFVDEWTREDRVYRIIPSAKEWYDVEVDGSSYMIWNAATKQYVWKGE